MVINGDVTMAISVGMDIAILHTVSWLTPVRVKTPSRIIWGSMIGSLPTLCVLLGGAVPVGGLMLALVPSAMCLTAFAPMPASRLWKALGWTYFSTAGLGGVILALISAGIPVLLVFLVVPVTVMAGVWWWRHEMIRPLATRAGHVPVRFWIDGQVIPVVALWDTGNQLREPWWGRPVMVVTYAVMESQLAPEARRWAERLLAGGVETVPLTHAGQWGVIRAMTAAGRRALPVFMADHAEVEVEGRWQALMPLAVGLTDSPISPNDEFQAILNPDSLAPSQSVGA